MPTDDASLHRKAESQRAKQAAKVVASGEKDSAALYRAGATADERRQIAVYCAQTLDAAVRSGDAPMEADAGGNSTNTKGRLFQSPVPGRPLAPRVAQTLERVLKGDSEKQIAAKLGLSPHTVHDYMKTLYREFGVSTRAELLALWVRT